MVRQQGGRSGPSAAGRGFRRPWGGWLSANLTRDPGAASRASFVAGTGAVLGERPFARCVWFLPFSGGRRVSNRLASEGVCPPGQTGNTNPAPVTAAQATFQTPPQPVIQRNAGW